MAEQGSVGREGRLVVRDLGRGLWRRGVQAERQKCSVTTQEVKDQSWSVYPYRCARMSGAGVLRDAEKEAAV